MGGLVKLNRLICLNLIMMLLGNKARTHPDKIKS